MGRVLLKIFDGLLLLITVVASMALVCAFLSGWIDPRHVWWVAFFGLFAPVVIAINLVLAAYWITRWKWIALLPTVLLLFGFGLIGRHMQMPVRKAHPAETSDLKIFTYNAHMFEGPEWQDKTNDVLDFIAAENPDVICIQEFRTDKRHPADQIITRLGKYPYSYIVYSRFAASVKTGLAVYSKYKIVKKRSVDFEKTSNGSVMADLYVGPDTVRLFNCHMQTSSIKREDIALLSVADLARTEDDIVQYKQMMHRLKVNNGVRATQADSIARLIQESPYPVIVCGDFNDTPLSYTYATVRDGMRDAFVDRGDGYGYTYKNLHRLLRIDYVFHDKRFRTVSYRSPDTLWSDHNPVIVELKIKENTKE